MTARYPLVLNGTTIQELQTVDTLAGQAASGANSDITSLTGLTTALSVGQGGSGATTLTGILKGNGSGAFTAVTAPTGTLVGTTDTQTLTNKLVNALNVFETRVVLSANSTTGATITIDLNTGGWFALTNNATISNFSVTNIPTAASSSAGFILDLTNGGAYSITFTINTVAVKWIGGTAPTLTSSSGKDSIAFVLNSDGTWTGFVLGKDLK